MRIARGASWASCELRDASCASMSAVVPHGAKERSAGGMRPLARYLGPRWFSLPQSSRSCRARGAPFSLVGVWRSCRRSSFLHSASPARVCCDAPLSRHASGACGSLLSASGERRGVSLACVLRAARDLLSSYSGRSAASLSCLVLVVRVSLLRRSLCLLCAASSLLAPSAQPASERRQYARSATPGGVWCTCAWIRAGHSPYRARALFRCVCRCVRGPTGHWPLASAPAACCGSLKGHALAWVRAWYNHSGGRPPSRPAMRHATAASTLHHLHQTCITCIKPASPASRVHHLHQTCITCITRASRRGIPLVSPLPLGSCD